MGLMHVSTFKIGLACLLGTLVALATSSCIDDPFEHSKCRTVPVAETPSPDGKYKVVVANHSCKPETTNIIARYVRLQLVNTHSMDTGTTIFIITGKNEIKPVWTDATHLRIESPGLSESMVELRHDEWNDVAITYDFKSP